MLTKTGVTEMSCPGISGTNDLREDEVMDVKIPNGVLTNSLQEICAVDPPDPLYCNFDGMNWPKVGPRFSDIEWDLSRGKLSRRDELAVSSIVAAYRELVTCSRRKRAKVVRKLKRFR